MQNSAHKFTNVQLSNHTRTHTHTSRHTSNLAFRGIIVSATDLYIKDHIQQIYITKKTKHPPCSQSNLTHPPNRMPNTLPITNNAQTNYQLCLMVPSQNLSYPVINNKQIFHFPLISIIMNHIRYLCCSCQGTHKERPSQSSALYDDDEEEYCR